MHVRECMDKMPLWTFVNKRPIYIYIYTLYLHTDEHQCSRISKSLLPTLTRQLHRFLVGHDAGRYAKIAPITSSGFDGGTRFSQSSCLATWMFSQRYWRLINEDLSSLVKTQCVRVDFSFIHESALTIRITLMSILTHKSKYHDNFGYKKRWFGNSQSYDTFNLKDVQPWNWRCVVFDAALHDNHWAGRGTQYAWLVLLDTFIAGDLPFSRPQRVLKILKIIDNMFFS